MLSLILHRTRYNPSAPKSADKRSEGILVYKYRSNVVVPDCCWLVGYAESNGLAGRLLPQPTGGYKALRWRERGGYVDLGVFADIPNAIKALSPKKV